MKKNVRNKAIKVRFTNFELKLLNDQVQIHKIKNISEYIRILIKIDHILTKNEKI